MVAAVHLGVLHKHQRKKNITTLKRRMRNNRWQHEVFKITLKRACRLSIIYAVSRSTVPQRKALELSARDIKMLRRKHAKTKQKESSFVTGLLCQREQSRGEPRSASKAESRLKDLRSAPPARTGHAKAFRNTLAHSQTVRRFIQMCAGGMDFSTSANFPKFEPLARQRSVRRFSLRGVKSTSSSKN